MLRGRVASMPSTISKKRALRSAERSRVSGTSATASAVRKVRWRSESTRGGAITQNCYDSITQTNIELPDWFRETTGEHVTLGVL